MSYKLFEIRRIGRMGEKKHLPMKLLDTSSKHKVMGYSLFGSKIMVVILS
jgi:hypothetical protein